MEKESDRKLQVCVYAVANTWLLSAAALLQCFAYFDVAYKHERKLCLYIITDSLPGIIAADTHDMLMCRHR